MTAKKGSMMATVGVLCARGRIEENAIMAALAEAGIVSALFPPADEPLPVGPMSPSPTGRPFPVPQIVVDRHSTRDRKSTRLNSSHTVISYAVFCLKKKT